MSKIEWTHRPGTKSEVLNPTTGCNKKSRGCKFCYAEKMHKRLRGMGQKKYQQPFLDGAVYWPEELAKPFKWKKPRTVFLNSMSDIFHPNITVQQIAEIYAMMFLTQWHTYIVLTKVSDRAAEVLTSKEFWNHYIEAVNNLPYKSVWSTKVWSESELYDRWPLKNVVQGVSVENSEQTNRIRDLAKTPSYLAVVSIEPMVGPVDLYEPLNNNADSGLIGLRLIDILDWVIVGGESGGKGSPMHPDWVRSVRDQCQYGGASFFFKQWGDWAPDRVLNNNEELAHVFDNEPDPGYPVEIINHEGKHNSRLLIEPITEPHVRMLKMGKDKSGNYLDGVQHLQYPW